MGVKTVKAELLTTKEFREIVDFLGAVLTDVKAGKSPAEIALTRFPALSKAVEGFDQLPEEVQSEYLADNSAYLVKTVMNLLRKKKTVQPAKNKGGLVADKKTTKTAKKATKKVAKKATKKVAKKAARKRRK